MSKKQEDDGTGCAIIFIIFIVIVWWSISIGSHVENLKQTKIADENKELLLQDFEVKELFVVREGNKPANAYIAYECIVESVEDKHRLKVKFDDNSLPVVGDIWKIKIIEQLVDGGKIYALHEKVE